MEATTTRISAARRRAARAAWLAALLRQTAYDLERQTTSAIDEEPELDEFWSPASKLTRFALDRCLGDDARPRRGEALVLTLTVDDPPDVCVSYRPPVDRGASYESVLP